MKIVHFCPSYVDLDRETGGVSNIVRQLALHSACFGLEVSLVCGNREMGRICGPVGNFREKNLYMSVVDQFANPLLGPIGNLKKLISELKQPTIAHVHTCFSLFTETSLYHLHRAGIPIVFTPHGKLTSTVMRNRGILKSLWWKLFAKRRVSSASKIVASSPSEAAHIVQMIGPGVDVEAIPNGFQRFLAPTGDRMFAEPYILFLGYLDPRKQPSFLLKAFQASEARHSHKLVFVGPDAFGQRHDLEKQTRESGLSDKVIFYGSAYGKEKWNLLQNASCMCLPSIGEGLPVVLMEAIGAQTPSIASVFCNFEHIAKTGVGVTLNGFSCTEWASAIDRVCLNQHAGEAMRDACRVQSSKFEWSAITSLWIDKYKETLGA